MAFLVSSSIFNGIRHGLVADGLSDAHLGKIASYIDRSEIFGRRVREFEQAGGQIEYDSGQKNFFWVNEDIPTVYVSTDYKNTQAGEPNIDELGKVIAHEMSHFETYFKNGFNPNNANDADGAGASGSRDEARAYSLEYLIESEINQTEPIVEWTNQDQRELAKAAIDAIPPEKRTEIAMLDAATLSLLDWAANWTGPSIDAGGYFQFYKNDWLKIQTPPGNPVRVSEVTMRCDASGTILEIRYVVNIGETRTVVLDRERDVFVIKHA